MARRLCDVDGQAFYGEKSVYEHNKMHLGIKYECVMCQKTFSTENYLKNHAKVVHFQGQNTCKACDAVFTTGRDLRRHENSVHGKKSYSCISCAKEFSRKDHVKAHFRVCKIINKSDTNTKQKESLIQDEMTTFFDEPNKKYQSEFTNFVDRHTVEYNTCNQCSKSFSSKNSLSDRPQKLQEEKFCST